MWTKDIGRNNGSEMTTVLFVVRPVNVINSGRLPFKVVCCQNQVNTL